MTVTWREGDGPPVSPPPQPAPAPSTPAPAPTVDLSGVQQEIVDLRAYVAALTLDQAAALGSFRQTLEQHRALLDDLGARVVELQARPVVRGCRASLSGIIPISCRVE